QRIVFTFVRLAEEVDPFGVLQSFPTIRTLTDNALHFLMGSGRFGTQNDALLRALVMHGFWVLCGMSNAHITDEGILDFAFGAYENGKTLRRLQLVVPNGISSRFLTKLLR
ncbi:hypothetical protein AAVH_37935, partial [Aphelenchoides avenae]